MDAIPTKQVETKKSDYDQQVAKQKAKSASFAASFDHFFALLDEDTE